MPPSVMIYVWLLTQSPPPIIRRKKMNNLKQLLLNINKHIIQFLIDKPMGQNIIETLCHRSCKEEMSNRGRRNQDIWII
jgi:hypothetical protein